MDKENYTYADIVNEIIRIQKIDAESDIYESEKKRIRQLVIRGCESIGKYWGIEPLIEYICGEKFFYRVVNIILQMTEDPRIKKIMNRINSDKNIKEEEEEVHIINEVSINILLDGKSKKEQNEIKKEYNAKNEFIKSIEGIQKKMEEQFKVSYNEYIEEFLNEFLKMKAYNTKTAKERLEEVNNEILQTINEKTNTIKYNNSLRKIIIDIDWENINKEEIKEKIKKIGKLYSKNSDDVIKDIDRIKFNENGQISLR